MYPSAWAMTVFPPLVFFSHNFFPPLDVIFQGDRFLKVGGGGGGGVTLGHCTSLCSTVVV